VKGAGWLFRRHYEVSPWDEAPRSRIPPHIATNRQHSRSALWATPNPIAPDLNQLIKSCGSYFHYV
jgi:hypothetical protein